MKNNLIPEAGLIYLKNYVACFLTIEDANLIKEGLSGLTFLPIPLRKVYFEILGFSVCHDRFGKGDYYKGWHLNIWRDKDKKYFYIRNNRQTYYFQYLHEFHYFLMLALNGMLLFAIDFTKLVEPINEYYKKEGQLFKKKWTKPYWST